jgi:hypothetical protein
MLNKTYKINESKAISETIDGETIIINLETGYYYSVNKTATIIWNQFQEDNSPQNIVKYLLDHYEVDKDTAESHIREITSLLVKDELILELDSDASPMESSGNVVKGTFIMPQIERYDDMAGALMSDPVHDVNQDGWPNLKH